MAVLRALLPQLGLSLCLALCFSPAFSASYNDSCMVFDTVSTSDNLGISTKAEVSGGNRTYTVSVPVNSSISAVILKAVNQNNNTVGSWVGAAQECNDTSVLYSKTPSNNSTFQAMWIAPDSEDVTKVNLQVFIVTVNRTATVSSVRLEQITTPAPLTPTPEISGTSQTTTMTTDKTAAMTTTMTTTKTAAMTTTMTTDKTAAMTTTMTTDKTVAMTTTNTAAKTTATSLAVNALGSPIAGALHILLVFLISKLLF